MSTSRRSTIAALALVLPLGLAACGSSANAGGTGGSSTSGSSTSSSSSAAMASRPFGPGCAAVPSTGKGSFAGMATDPVATAASSNRLLRRLVGAIKGAGLVQTLDSAQDITVLAPTNDAFTAVPKATMDAAMKDPEGLLSTVLRGHVLAGRLTPEQLVGRHKTLAGSTITVKGSGNDLTVDTAKVLCGNVQTANATVYIIDRVLLPPS